MIIIAISSTDLCRHMHTTIFHVRVHTHTHTLTHTHTTPYYTHSYITPLIVTHCSQVPAALQKYMGGREVIEAPVSQKKVKADKAAAATAAEATAQ